MILYNEISFQEYQNLAEKYMPTTSCPPLAYLAMSLNGEAGEVAEKIKRVYRGDEEAKSIEYNLSIAKELGDVLWNIANIATLLDLSLDNIARINIEKMEKRYKEGKLKGTGDDR